MNEGLTGLERHESEYWTMVNYPFKSDWSSILQGSGSPGSGLDTAVLRYYSHAHYSERVVYKLTKNL